MNKYNRKKLMLLTLLLSISMGCSSSKQEKDNDIYSSYSMGNVYIGSHEFLSTIKKEKDDILILDKRENSDPDIKIYDSYLITDSEIIDEILDIIMNYEKEFPSNWNRSKDTMKLEWYIHNMAYYLNYQKERTKDVDLNNDDEEYYKNKNFIHLLIDSIEKAKIKQK